ncbi:hypothetical protein M8C21_002912 [Ambrosia artemisiifolia]|uniref:Replication factor A C-terminal domain-containing protein n=1 Tax=Ambrosia artemisiifolia TaxID=4212 RepID=A0AAD5CTY0_AMBAR|nr:hypothetical protein M8C21_002912 [Ambrosia artemisiifolia]
MPIMEEVNQLHITLEELSDATNGFSDENLIAMGGFGKVYKGISIKRGSIAIKVPSDSLSVYGKFAAYYQGQSRNTETACRGVSLIRDEDSADPIEVRLIRKWQSFAFKDDCFYLFVDKEGYAIEGCGHNRDKAYFEAKMNLQGCYRISDYLSQKPHKSHNVVPGQATIKIAKGTSFMPIDPTGFPSHYFNFLPFEGLPNKIQTNYLLTDYIGCFVSITMDKATPTGRRLLKFLLEDPNGNYIEVALWQEIADRVDIPTLTSTPFPCIVAVTSMKVKEYHRITLESNSPTNVYINPEIPDTYKLVERFNTKYANVPEHLRGRRHVMRLKTRYANIPKQQRRRFTVAELLQMNPAQNSERRFSCMATVKNFVQGKPWFYRGCIHCKRKLLRRSPGWACSYHPNEQQQKFMYCVNAVIEDKSDTTTVTLFDGAVYSLAQINAMTLVLEKGFEDANILPDPLHVIIGKRTVFQLQFNNRVQQEFTRFISNKLLQNPIVAEEIPENNTQGPELQPVQQGRETDTGAPPLTTPAALPSPNRQLDADAPEEGTNMPTVSTKRQLQLDNREANKDKRSRTKE